jgi:hypothetical protein
MRASLKRDLRREPKIPAKRIGKSSATRAAYPSCQRQVDLARASYRRLGYNYAKIIEGVENDRPQLV